MESRSERATRYRHYAEELRVVAEGWKHVENINKLNMIADDYDQMAEDLEKTRGPKVLVP